MTETSYVEKIQHFQEERSKNMIANPLNWLSLIGLFLLKEGDNYYGSGDRNEIVIPELPYKKAGGFQVAKGMVTLIGTSIDTTVNGKPPVSRPLHADTDKSPDLLEIGPIAMMVLKRGDKHLLRVWNREAPAVKEFKGLNYYPVNPDYCLTAVFTPYDPPKPVKVIDVIGTERMSTFAGQAAFTLFGREYTLEAEDAEDELLFSFKDETRIDDTYPGGRVLVVPRPETGSITLDFNRAVNWPCAYTPFATCPLPPVENHLPVRIEAGEKRYH